MKNRKIIFLFVALLIIPLISKWGYISTVDSSFGINALALLRKTLYSWNDQVRPGWPQSVPSVSLYVLQSLFNVISERFTYTSFISILSLCTLIYSAIFRLLNRTINPSSKTAIFVVAAVSLFSISNDTVRGYLSTNINICWGVLLGFLSYIFFIKSILSKQIFHFCLFCLIFQFTLIDIHTSYIVLLFCSISFLYFLMTKSKVIRISPKRMFVYLIIFLLTNMYWISCNAQDLINKNDIYTKATGGAQQSSVFDYINSTDNFIYNNIASLQPITGASTWINTVDYILSYSILIISFLSLFFVTTIRNNKLKLLIYLSLILTVFSFSLSFGPKDPLGIFNFLWNYLPGFKIFREFLKFQRPLIFTIPILSAFTLLCIYKKSHLTAIILSTIFIINIIFAYIPYINDFKPIIIPESYFNIQKILNNKSIDASVMLVPVSSWVNSYSWTNNSNRGAISEPLKYFSDKSLNFNQVSYLKDNNETANEQIVNYLLTGYPTESAELISSRNIKFIITKNDILPKQNLSINNQVSNELQLTPMYVDNNTISLYEINSKLVYTPIIYLADNNRKTSIVYKKINPTKYRILINNITNTSNLVFSDSFSNRWKIYLNNNQNINIDGSKYISENYKGTIQNDNLNDGLPWETWQSKPVVNEDNHSMVNGFANKWSIDIKKICSNNNACIMNKDGSYNISIILEYDTQKYYFIGLLVSGISLAISLLYVIYYSLRKLMAKYHSVHRDNSIKVK